MERLNTALVPFGFRNKEVSVDASINVFAMVAAVVEFSIVKLQIKFGYYFYVKSSMPDQDQEEEDENIAKRTSKRMDKIVKSFVYVNFLAPVVIVLIFINPLSKDLIVPEYISAETYTVLKIFVVILCLIFRTLTFREEC